MIIEEERRKGIETDSFICGDIFSYQQNNILTAIPFHSQINENVERANSDTLIAAIKYPGDDSKQYLHSRLNGSFKSAQLR